MKKITKVFFIMLSVFLLMSCSSTTLIQSEPSGARVYINDQPAGITPLSMTDTKIIGTCTYIRLEKENYETFNTSICRDENVDGCAVVGGIFFMVPFLWTMAYNPTHYYELAPLAEEPNSTNAPQDQMPKSKADKLRELKQLLDEGIITKDEFDKEKAKILEEK